MSLFKAREWWGTTAGEEEEFDQGALCVANIDNSPDGTDKITVGSFHGFLRIYNPRPTKTENGWSGYKAEDVICELQLSSPILQVDAGKFVSGTDNLHLAVLHPRKLAVYNVSASSGVVQHGTQYQMKLIYEHNLQRTAFCFCHGSFGGVKGRDFICVQSMDGTVSFFEQESFAFSRFLPGALLPGPLKYIAKTDCFVTVSSSRQVECYKYQVLAVATDARSKEESQSIKSGKKVASDWTFNIGEQAVQLAVVTFSSAPLSIYVLGERSLFCLTETGKLRFMKKLDYNPSCFIPYTASTEGKISCIVGTHTETLMIYQESTLRWAAQLQRVPIAVRIGNFLDLQGIIVTLDETGKLQCVYLGTDPAILTSAAVTSTRWEYNINDIDHEMKILQQKIREHSHKGIMLPNVKSEDEITLDATIPQELDNPSRAMDLEFEDEDIVPSITVKIHLKSKAHVSDVKLSVIVSPPLHVDQPLYTFSAIDPTKAVEAAATIYMRQGFMPANLKAEVIASYHNATGAPRSAHLTIRLPMKLAIKPALPVKNASYKLTIESNKPTTMLNELFPDLLLECTAHSGNALGFHIYGGPLITVLASKNAQKYRLQSEVFEAMWLVANELVNRLYGYYRSRGQSDFYMFFDSQLPLHEYFEVIDRHFECRLNDEKYKQLLSERATQFRAIQRRLLTRFKDKTPAPLQNLDTLLDGSYRQLLALADKTEENKMLELRAASELSCATSLINLLIKLWTRMNDAEYAVLNATLIPDVSDNCDQGWEETVDATMTHLLRTVLAKNSKDQTVNPSPLGVPKDTSKLKKHIAMICDRLSKGAKLVVEGMEPIKHTHTVSSAPSRSAPKKDPITIATRGVTEDAHEPSPQTDLGEPEVPVGSKFGEPTQRVNNQLPPMGMVNGTHTSNLPPLQPPPYSEIDTANLTPDPPKKDFRKKKKEVNETVPDLDELGTVESDDRLINGGNELVYGL